MRNRGKLTRQVLFKIADCEETVKQKKFLTLSYKDDKIVNVRGRAKALPQTRQRKVAERRFNMAEKTITEVQALNIARSLVECYILDGAEFENAEFTPEEVAEKLDKMIATRSKKRVRKTDDSKRLANIALGEQFAEIWTGGNFKASDVAATLEVSTPKANAIAKACGWAEVPTTEKVKVYTLTPDED